MQEQVVEAPQQSRPEPGSDVDVSGKARTPNVA